MEMPDATLVAEDHTRLSLGCGRKRGVRSRELAGRALAGEQRENCCQPGNRSKEGRRAEAPGLAKQ